MPFATSRPGAAPSAFRRSPSVGARAHWVNGVRFRFASGLGSEQPSGMRDFHGLRVWRAGHQLTLSVYHETQKYPADERFGLRAQMRRSAASIPTNIAEACGRQGDGDQVRFFHFAMGSASELEYQLELSRDLGYVTGEVSKNLTAQVVDVKRMLSGLTRPRTADGGQRMADPGPRKADGGGRTA